MKRYISSQTRDSFAEHCAKEGFTLISTVDAGMYGNCISFLMDKDGTLWQSGSYQSCGFTNTFTCEGELEPAQWGKGVGSCGYLSEANYWHCEYESFIRQLNEERRYLSLRRDEWLKMPRGAQRDRLTAHIEARTETFLRRLDELHALRGYVFAK